MRVSIIVADKVVCVDGVCHQVIMPSLSPGLHAIQWYETWGEEEWANENGVMQSNNAITSFEEYSWCIELWNVAHQAWLDATGGLV